MQVKCAEFAQQTGQIPGPVQARGKVSIPGSIRHAQAGERRVSDLQFEMMNFLFQCTDELMPVLHRPQFLRHRRRDPALECGVRKQFEKTGAGGFERDRGMRWSKHEDRLGFFTNGLDQTSIVLVGRHDAKRIGGTAIEFPQNRNLVNSKGYVGQTILTSRKRWSLHKSVARRGEDFPIYRAIRKYGAENFSIKVLAVVDPQQLDDLEKKYIKDLNTHVDNGCGYNCDEGGRGNRGFFSKETRLKISAIQKARWKTNPELRALWGATVKALRAAHPEILLRQAESMRAVHVSHPELSREHANRS